MSKYSLIVIFCFLSAVYPTDNYKQVIQQKSNFGGKIPRLMPVIFRVYPVAIDQNQLKLYFLADIVYDFMQFTLRENKYFAKIEVEVNLKNQKTEHILSKTWRSFLEVLDFKETNVRNKFFLTTDSIEVSPGNYELKVIYRDLQGKQRQQFTLSLQLSDLKDNYFSPPLFCTFNSDGSQYSSTFPARPLALREHLLFNKQYGIYLNVWNSDEEFVDVDLSIFKPTVKEPFFHKDTLLQIRSKHTNAFFNIPSIEWDEGNYQLSINYKFKDDSSTQKMPIKIIWFDKPQSLNQYEYAIQPLELLLPNREYKALTSGNKGEKLDAFHKYWKEKDPSKGSAFNEVLLEFYSRVDSVDQKWSRKRSKQYGWRTDPGKIYLLYGKPDEINDASLDPVEPHMSWIYDYRDHRMIFKFAALDGRKRYRLVDEIEVQKP